jgi:hypothetical protein
MKLLIQCGGIVFGVAVKTNLKGALHILGILSESPRIKWTGDFKSNVSKPGAASEAFGKIRQSARWLLGQFDMARLLSASES